ncbi:carboxymuconolactone decarboxylase family protein [Lysobacter sp. LF1]|uniref:Carboxymuconolactone decarboxylase family protein n=1 Tax=Lysobacter stagni TaxID=3045172 RepID=A0ABT6XJA0_9GAMM|nr:carboxymuconolactone decarboxylase family protein [Lysobacter sp. LF1]MDI9240212.1 carboxymuconolactone decarboxylase family protein [Lysobacter sp. LF1]
MSSSYVSHTPRVDYIKHAKEAFQAQVKLSMAVHAGSLGSNLVELVFLRVSQINGCAYCLDMHTTALRKGGEDQRRLDTLAGWRDSPLFDGRERAALDWAEALTRLENGHVADDVFEALRPHFDDRGIAELTFAVGVINSWNRINVSLRTTLP